MYNVYKQRMHKYKFNGTLKYEIYMFKDVESYYYLSHI